jgi:hypothetical protein
MTSITPTPGFTVTNGQYSRIVFYGPDVLVTYPQIRVWGDLEACEGARPSQEAIAALPQVLRRAMNTDGEPRALWEALALANPERYGDVLKALLDRSFPTLLAPLLQDFPTRPDGQSMRPVLDQITQLVPETIRRRVEVFPPSRSDPREHSLPRGDYVQGLFARLHLLAKNAEEILRDIDEADRIAADPSYTGDDVYRLAVALCTTWPGAAIPAILHWHGSLPESDQARPLVRDLLATVDERLRIPTPEGDILL